MAKPYDDDKDWVDTAQICLEGHVITGEITVRPEEMQLFCARCGAKTVTACPQCESPIHGVLQLSGMSFYPNRPFDRPSFCTGCGAEFPWTTSALAASRELADMLDRLSDRERELVKQDILDVTRETARTPAAANRLKILFAKAGGEVPGMIRELLVDLASATARQHLGL